MLPAGVTASDEIIGGADSENLYVTPDSFSVPLQLAKVNIRTGARQPIATIVPGMDPAGVQLILAPLVTADEKQYVFTQVRVLSVLYVAKGLK